MPAPIYTYEEIIAEVARTTSLKNSLLALIAGIEPRVQAAVAAAIAADDAGDQGTADVANAAIANAFAELRSNNNEFAAALAANPSA